MLVLDVFRSPHILGRLGDASHLWEPVGEEAEVFRALGFCNLTEKFTCTPPEVGASPWEPGLPLMEISKDQAKEKRKGYLF